MQVIEPLASWWRLSSALSAAILLGAGPSLPLKAQERTAMRIVIATNVVCRAEPSVAAPVVASLRLGELFLGSPSSRQDDGIWYNPRSGRCWTHGSLTHPFDSADRGDSLLVIADRLLGRDDASFEEHVEVENLFQTVGFADAVSASPQLQLRRLMITDQAGRRLAAEVANRDPLKLAWVLAKGETLRGTFGGTWFVPRELFWDLYDAHEHSDAAEEIAWTAAQLPMNVDECWAACHLRILVDPYRQYWLRQPSGAHIGEALSRATALVDRATRYCALIAMEPPYLLERGSISEGVRELRESLNRVTAAEKEALLAQLDEIEAGCVEARLSEDDPEQLIAALTRALGTGVSLPRRTLAGFGDRAVPHVVNAARTATYPSDIEGALFVAACLIQREDENPLSAESRESIRHVAEFRLEGEQPAPVLWNAMRLAGALGDPELNLILEQLASDEGALRARGVVDRHIERTQRIAGEQLRGAPARPGC